MFPGTYAASTPDKAAIVMADSKESVTYAELDLEAMRLSHVLHDAGVRPGDHVAFCLENHQSFLKVMWGAHYAGAYYTPIGTRLTAPEVAYTLRDCGAKAFITTHTLAGLAGELVGEDLPQLTLHLMLGGTVAGYLPYERLVSRAPSLPLAIRPEGRDMVYSSGTTGRPKGIKVMSPPSTLGDPDPGTILCQELFGVSDDTVYLSPAPLYHAAPMRFCRAIQRTGGTVVVMEQFDPRQYLELVERHRVTFSQLVPTMFVRMLKLPSAVRAAYDLSSLRTVVHAAAPCPVDVKQAMIDWWGPIIHEYYAGTEGNGFVYSNSREWLDHPGAVGRAITGTVHILDERGREQPPGRPGTVYFEGGGEFVYHNDPAKTAAARDPQGRGLTTLGDVGWLSRDGYLYLTDRLAHTIIVGGVNVYPQEAENVLTMHPAVDDVAVLGVPNDDLGEEVKAVVKPADAGAVGPDLERELIEYCRSRLASVKCPRSVDFKPQLPRSATGKLLKRLLRDEYWQAAGRSI
jgi:acyl-CoA synthetase (AMP-forming)/AMP-acid ligase II